MYDVRGKRVYDLFYFAREPIAMNRMKEAMGKLAPSGDFTFRARFANQEVILAEVVDTDPFASTSWSTSGAGPSRSTAWWITS